MFDPDFDAHFDPEDFLPEVDEFDLLDFYHDDDYYDLDSPEENLNHYDFEPNF